MRKVVVYLVALLATCVLTVVSVRVVAGHTTVLDRYRTGEAAPPPEVLPASGQASVTGTVRRLSADADEVPQMTAPFTLTALVRGAGTATIDNAIVGGKRVTISWPGGTPLPIDGTGALLLGAPVRVDVEGAILTWTIDGGARTFVPGTYRAAAPVAVGSSGIAAPRDSAEFVADAQTLLQTSGGVVVRTPLDKLTLKGPGKIVAEGRLRVRYPTSVHQAAKVQFGEGKYELTLVQSGTELSIDAKLEGPIRTD